jgi:hypothetical protein
MFNKFNKNKIILIANCHLVRNMLVDGGINKKKENNGEINHTTRDQNLRVIL